MLIYGYNRIKLVKTNYNTFLLLKYKVYKLIWKRILEKTMIYNSIY